MESQSVSQKKSQNAMKRAAHEAFWRDVWKGRGWIARMLTPLSVLFLLISQIRRTLYRTGFFESQSVAVPVVVIGGIMIGGVGKTPVVTYVARALQQAGFKPAIISRGYTPNNENKNLQPRAVTDLSSPDIVGDEPILHRIKTGLPVWVGHRRALTARMVHRVLPECDVIICDDGLQHYALAHDIEIVVMDERGVGNGWCLPAGSLREPPSRLKEADIVVWHRRCGDEREVRLKMQNATVHKRSNDFNFYSYVSDAYDLLDPSYRLPLSYFAGKPTLAMAGIAQPEVFFNMLESHNIHGEKLPLPDHFRFDEEFTRRECLRDVQYILMTEKDAVKYHRLIMNQPDRLEQNQQRFWVVPLEVIDNEESQKMSAFLIQRLKELRLNLLRKHGISPFLNSEIQSIAIKLLRS